MLFLFDTSAVNRLHDDPDGGAIVTDLLATSTVRVSALNVLEVGRTSKIDRRRSLLRLLKRMTGVDRPFELPNTLVRRAMAAYGARRLSLDYSIDSEAEILWQVLVEPEQLDEDVRRGFNVFHRSMEADFLVCHQSARPHFQALVIGDVVAPCRAPALLRAYKSRPQFVLDVVNPIYRPTVGADLPLAELGLFFQVVPEVAGLLLAWAHSVHQRAIALEDFGVNNAGIVDLWFATYLNRVDRFITADEKQYRALRLVARVVAPQCEVMRYSAFRRCLPGLL